MYPIPKGGIMLANLRNTLAIIKSSLSTKILIGALFAVLAVSGFVYQSGQSNAAREDMHLGGRLPQTQASIPNKYDGVRYSNIVQGAKSLGSIDELRNQVYNTAGNRSDQYDDIDAIFRTFGITPENLNANNMVSGYYRASDNSVVANGRVVVNNVITAGRDGNGAYFKNVDTDGADLWVKLDGNGNFMFAIMKICGNPIPAPTPPPPPPPPPAPTYSCDALSVKKIGDNKVEATVATSQANGAIFKDVTFNFGDGSANVVTADKIADHQYQKDGTYKITAVPQFTVNGTVVKAESKNCVAEVAINIPVPAYNILKQVQTIGSDKWSEDVTVPSGAEVKYRVVITSTGNAPATNVIASDKLPAGVTYKKDTLKRDNVAVDYADKFFAAGQNIGTLAPNTTTTFTFNATAGTADLDKCKASKMTNVASITADKLPKKEDDANVSVTCEKISCDTLTATSLGNRKFQYKVTYTATTGATFQTASYNFGDNSNALVTDKTTVEHTYATDGTYTTAVELTFLVNGKQQKVTSDNCKVTVQASTPPAMCTIPGKQHLPANSPECAQDVVVPTVIPNTGAGSLIALFVGSSIISTFAYRFWISKNQV